MTRYLLNLSIDDNPVAFPVQKINIVLFMKETHAIVKVPFTIVSIYQRDYHDLTVLVSVTDVSLPITRRIRRSA